MLIIIDKPQNKSSNFIAHLCKKVFPGQKIGHGGTLDPMATGMLILGIGKSTKLLPQLQIGEKEYEATIDFSKISDTRDKEYRDMYQEFPIQHQGPKIGIIKDEKFIPAPDLDHIQSLLQSLVPEASLPLTPFSAKKKEGKKYYEFARKGKPIFEQKIMKILEVEILDYNFPELKIRVKVGGGTYIRSIAYRLGQEVGLGGILTSLRRTALGCYRLKDFTYQILPGTDFPYAEITLP